MATTIRSQVEDAVVTALVALSYFTTANTTVWNGPTEFEEDDEDYSRSTRAGAPSALVMTGPGDYERHGLRRTQTDLKFNVEIIITSGNLRSAESRTRGDAIDATDLGIYKMIEDIRGALFGVELGVSGAGFLRPINEAPVARSNSRSVWKLTYSIDTDVDIDLESSDTSYSTMRTTVNNPDDDSADPILDADRTLAT